MQLTRLKFSDLEYICISQFRFSELMAKVIDSSIRYKIRSSTKFKCYEKDTEWSTFELPTPRQYRLALNLPRSLVDFR